MKTSVYIKKNKDENLTKSELWLGVAGGCMLYGHAVSDHLMLHV